MQSLTLASIENLFNGSCFCVLYVDSLNLSLSFLENRFCSLVCKIVARGGNLASWRDLANVDRGLWHKSNSFKKEIVDAGNLLPGYITLQKCANKKTCCCRNNTFTSDSINKNRI